MRARHVRNAPGAPLRLPGHAAPLQLSTKPLDSTAHKVATLQEEGPALLEQPVVVHRQLHGYVIELERIRAVQKRRHLRIHKGDPCAVVHRARRQPLPDVVLVRLDLAHVPGVLLWAELALANAGDQRQAVEKQRIARMAVAVRSVRE